MRLSLERDRRRAAAVSLSGSRAGLAPAQRKCCDGARGGAPNPTLFHAVAARRNGGHAKRPAYLSDHHVLHYTVTLACGLHVWYILSAMRAS